MVSVSVVLLIFCVGVLIGYRIRSILYGIQYKTWKHINETGRRKDDRTEETEK